MISMEDFPLEGRLFHGNGLRVERLTQGVLRVVLARPERRNAFDAGMISELSRSLEELAALPAESMRLLLLDGEGECFCAGADLGYMRSQAESSMDQNLEDARTLGRMFHRLATFPAPVICVVKGGALGGGLGLAVCADFVIADASAVFAATEVRLGIVPATISPYILRRLGLSQAAPLMLAGAHIGAAEAQRIGLVHRIVEPEPSWDDALQTTIREFLAAGPEAARRTKGLLQRLAPLPDPELVEYTARITSEVRVSEEGQVGLRAFFEKAPPPWVPDKA